MAIDVWAVKTEYHLLERPDSLICEFLFDLMLDPDTGVGEDPWDDDTWGGSWDNNGLYEFRSVGLRKRANNWANGKGLTQVEKAKLCGWIRNLPWQDDNITLHLGN